MNYSHASSWPQDEDIPILNDDAEGMELAELEDIARKEAAAQAAQDAFNAAQIAAASHKGMVFCPCFAGDEIWGVWSRLSGANSKASVGREEER